MQFVAWIFVVSPWFVLIFYVLIFFLSLGVPKSSMWHSSQAYTSEGGWEKMKALTLHVRVRCLNVNPVIATVHRFSENRIVSLSNWVTEALEMFNWTSAAHRYRKIVYILKYFFIYCTCYWIRNLYNVRYYYGILW